MNTSAYSKNKRYTALAIVLAVLVLAVAIPINLIFDRINVYVDMTPNSLYTLTPKTEEYLNALDEEGVKVDVYFLTKMEDISESLELLALYRTLLAYDAHECFNLIDFDSDAEPEKMKELDPDSIYNLQDSDFLFSYNGMVKRLPGSMLYAIQYKTDANGNQIVQSADFCAENYFTGYMKSVVEGEKPTVYFLEGLGEKTVNDMAQLCANLRNNNYSAETLNLINEPDVPEDSCIVVIAGPTKDITDDEFQKLYDYTKRGGNISILMDPNDGAFAYKNIEQLMYTFCIGMNYDRIHETDSAKHKSNDPFVFMCDVVEAAPDAEYNITGDLTGATGLLTYMPRARSFYSVITDTYGAMHTDKLLKTQKTALSEPWGGLAKDPSEVTGQELILAMYSEDTQRSNAKMTVFGSSEIISNIDEMYIIPLNLFLATVTWMYNPDDVGMAIADKAKTYDSLNINSSAEASGMIALFIVLPAAIALAGVIVWLRRKDA
ncbi:MAG: Gldg family protein [Oscillospiraceae bacterium]|nr:Gldg family protein [Oscillospiraceae bacterium]